MSSIIRNYVNFSKFTYYFSINEGKISTELNICPKSGQNKNYPEKLFSTKKITLIILELLYRYLCNRVKNKVQKVIVLNNNILLLEEFWGNEFFGKLYFARYDDNNPAIFFVSDNMSVQEFSVDNPEFYVEYPFGDYKLVIIKNLEITESLEDFGIVGDVVFSISQDEIKYPVCELSDQVVDLLKEHGKYYV